MENALRIGFLATAQLASSEDQASPSRVVILTRGRRVVSHAKAAKTNMGEGYGTDITAMSSADYKARIRRLMLRG